MTPDAIRATVAWHKFLAGNTAEFTAVYETARPLLVRYAYRRCMDRALADDAAHGALEWILSSRAHTDNILAVLFTATKNRVFNELRRWNPANCTFSAADDIVSVIHACAESPSPEIFLRGKELIDQVDKVLNECKKHDVECFVLSALDNMPDIKIAEVLGTSRGMVKYSIKKVKTLIANTLGLRIVGTAERMATRREHIIKLRKAGYSWTDITRITGCNDPLISAVLRDAGLSNCKNDIAPETERSVLEQFANGIPPSRIATGMKLSYYRVKRIVADAQQREAANA